jgi:regulator of protease activity HflC (stomatin/prohibitin superfamily)
MWKIVIGAVVFGAAVLLVSGAWQAGLAAGLFLALAAPALRASVVVVPARRAALIFSRLKLYAGLRGPGMSLILPFWEHVGGYLDLAPRARQISLGDLYTRDQVPVTISVSLIYHLDPWAIQPELRPQFVDLLESAAAAILQRQVEHLLRRLIGGQSLNTLLGPEFRACLEERLTQELPRRVGEFGIALSGPVMLGHIALPADLQAELNQAHQARIHAQARADALNTLKEALGAQPDPAWERAIEVETLEAMGRNGVPICWPYAGERGVGNARGRGNGTH